MLDGVAVVGGIAFLTAMLLDKTWILALVFMAIRGVENAQPWRWMGHEFSSNVGARDLAMAQFVRGGIITAVLFAVGAFCVVLMLRSDQRQRVWRLALLTISATCLGATVWFLTWCRKSVLPALSP